MATTTTSAPTLITNLEYGIDELQILTMIHLDNTIHSLLSDISFYLTNLANTPIKTAVRRVDDESFNLQEFINTADYELLITFENISITENLNDCKASQIRIPYIIYYKLEAKGNNASRLKRYLALVENLICNNYNGGNRWIYQYEGFEFSSNLQGFVNKLALQLIDYAKLETTNFYLARQDYSLLIDFKPIN